MSRQILIADDEPELAASLAWRLEQSGYEVRTVGDGPAAVAAVREAAPDLVLLDLVLPLLNGLEVLRRIRELDPDLPVVLVSGRSEESDRIAGLELGADDFVVKPFSPRELVARVGTVLRRSVRSTSPASDDGLLRLASLSIDRNARRVTIDGVEIGLSAKEYDLLMALAEVPDRVCSRDELLATVWPGSNAENPGATLTEHISRLRRKIEVPAEGPLQLVTVRGVGYRLSRS